MFIGLPALFVAFGRINGRPMYKTMGSFIGHLINPKFYVFHKEASAMATEQLQVATVTAEAPPIVDRQAALVKLKELNYVLEQQATEQQTVLNQAANRSS